MVHFNKITNYWLDFLSSPLPTRLLQTIIIRVVYLSIKTTTISCK